MIEVFVLLVDLEAFLLMSLQLDFHVSAEILVLNDAFGEVELEFLDHLAHFLGEVGVGRQNHAILDLFLHLLFGETHCVHLVLEFVLVSNGGYVCVGESVAKAIKLVVDWFVAHHLQSPREEEFGFLDYAL